MIDLLDAECVITRLCLLNIIKNKQWKSQQYNDDAQANYNVYFESPNKNSDIVLQIIKKTENYYVPRLSINILAIRHRFDPTNILTECSVAA